MLLFIRHYGAIGLAVPGAAAGAAGAEAVAAAGAADASVVGTSDLGATGLGSGFFLRLGATSGAADAGVVAAGSAADAAAASAAAFSSSARTSAGRFAGIVLATGAIFSRTAPVLEPNLPRRTWSYTYIYIYMCVLMSTLDIFIGLILMLAFQLDSRNRRPKLHYHQSTSWTNVLVAGSHLGAHTTSSPATFVSL